MVFDNIENITSLLCTIIGLLYCVFKYIETPRRGYRIIIALFLAKFLSEYNWTIYQLVMHDYPDVAEFTAYLGWNISYLIMPIAVVMLRSEKAKRYFHPVMLLPVLLHIPQFILYIQFGGILNNIWQVGTTTVTMVFCLQDLLYYWTHREEPRVFPRFSLVILLYLVLMYGMWTVSCFDWPSDLLNPYHYLSAVDSLLCVFFAYGARKQYEVEESGAPAKTASDLRFQMLVQTVISLVIIGICAAGWFTAIWLRDSMLSGNGVIQNEKQLVVWLFAISIALIVIVMVLLFLTGTRYRHIMAARSRMNEGRRSRLNFIITIGVTLALMVFAVVYNSVALYNASVVSVYENGEEAIKTTATELENYLTVSATTLRVAADNVDLMEKRGASIEDIRQYIVDQTTRTAEQFDENFTGLYAYINGEYLDGLAWVPPEGYEPTERDWYQAAAAAGGEIVIVSPYVDAQTNSVVITFAKGIVDDGSVRNVVCLDVIVNHIVELIQDVSIAGKGYGMVVNTDGFIIAHRDVACNGENASEIYDPTLLDSILETKSGRFTAEIDGEACTLFVAPVMNQWYTVIVIGNTELLEETHSQLAVNTMVSLVTFCLIAFFYYLGYKNEQIYGRKVEEMNLQVVSALATAIDAKDQYTNGHSTRVAEYARRIAARAGCSVSEQEDIYMMGLLHDVGKIGVPDSVINKPGRLTPEEYELIKKHSVIGCGILESIKERPKLATGARWHHERYDGRGYPDGIAGDAIPEEARIIAVADAYDAMTSRRSYRDVMSQAAVRAEIEKGAGTQFDPRFAAVMLQMIDEDTAYSMREKA